MRVAIAGGGIAGLSSAIALSARGIEVSLFERAPALEEVGAGIQLAPNATTLLERLGVMPDLAGRLSEPKALHIRDARNGTTLKTLPLGATMRRRYGAPYRTLLRADLQAALLAVARRATTLTLRLGAEVHDVRATESGVVFAAAGQSHRADVLLAADGVNSRIRQSYFRHPAPELLGHTAWRATIDAEEAGGIVGADTVGLWFGRGGHLVHYPVDGGRRVNIVVIAPGNSADPPRHPFGAQAKQLIAKPQAWTMSALMHVDAKREWTRGRVALVGDAAHAMAPSTAQGGAQAIEDACEIAARLASDGGEPARALSEYEQHRRARVERMAKASLSNLNVYGATGVAATARNLGLVAMPAEFLLSRLDWLFRAPG